MLAKQFDYIVSTDPAVDLPAEGDEEAAAKFSEAWRLYQDGQGEPPLKEQHKAVVWRLRPLGHRQLSYVANAGRNGGYELMGITAASIAIQGVQFKLNADGSAYEVPPKVRIDGIFQMTDAALDELDRDDLIELGSVVWARSQLSPLS